MKNKVLLGLAASAALAVGTTSGQPPRAQDPAIEIAELKRQVARLSADVSLLKQSAAASGEKDKELQQVVTYIEAQSRAAAHLQRVLAESDEKGFTFGINPESREVLLAGFDQFATTLQADVPGKKQDKP